jgi:hypothetical protein
LPGKKIEIWRGYPPQQEQPWGFHGRVYQRERRPLDHNWAKEIIVGNRSCLPLNFNGKIPRHYTIE